LKTDGYNHDDDNQYGIESFHLWHLFFFFGKFVAV